MAALVLAGIAGLGGPGTATAGAAPKARAPESLEQRAVSLAHFTVLRRRR